jgi:hypothetical protein
MPDWIDVDLVQTVLLVLTAALALVTFFENRTERREAVKERRLEAIAVLVAVALLRHLLELGLEHLDLRVDRLQVPRIPDAELLVLEGGQVGFDLPAELVAGNRHSGFASPVS